MEDLFERVLASEKTKEVWRKDYNSTQWKEANQLNVHLFGMQLNRSKKCECIEDLFLMMKRPNSLTKVKEEMAREFYLKKGKVLMNHAFPTPLTEHSTDEQLIAGLKAVPAIIVMFEKVPENWRAICDIAAEKGEGKKTPTPKVSDPTDVIAMKDSKELIAILESLGITPKPRTPKPVLVALVKANQK